ncbi:hydrogenase isoenzymes formation protein [Escherichia fergusonii]|nr:hydrogenase isoenzymes formation protein [Escherichia fergusonii]
MKPKRATPSDALQNMFDVEPDVGALLYGEEK